jgi:type IV pilus assembly protein PilP
MIIKIGLALILVLMLGCDSDDSQSLEAYIEQVKARPKQPLAALPALEVADDFVFKADGLRDPFQLPEKRNQSKSVDTPIANGIQPDLRRKKEVLETYALDGLKMVGTLSNQTGLWALVRAQDASIHRVKTGNHLGLNDGHVVRISKDKIEVMEIVPDKPGTWREQLAVLILAK